LLIEEVNSSTQPLRNIRATHTRKLIPPEVEPRLTTGGPRQPIFLLFIGRIPSQKEERST
jgi:hypothetical protein